MKNKTPNNTPTENMIEYTLEQAITQALNQLYPDITVPKIQVNPAAQKKFGDFQTNVAMQLAKPLKKNPMAIAEEIKAKLPNLPSINTIEVVKPGFINFFLANEYLAETIARYVKNERACVPEIGTSQTLILDYSSPNVAKPLHIGHIRSTILGNSLDRLFRFLGYTVVADNHIGDWGTQFGMLIYGYKNFLDKEAFQEDPLAELERIYIQTNQECEIYPEIKDQVRSELVKLQRGEPENFALWEEIISMGMNTINSLYQRLDVAFDTIKGESFYRDQLQDVVAELKEKNIATESEGAWVVFLEEEKLPPAIVRKKDGGFNYLTTDIATILHRLDHYSGVKQIIYITDERQQLHFKQLFTTMKKLNPSGLQDVHLEHVWFGLMRLPQGTFSTREGNVIKLEFLLDEAYRRAKLVVDEASPHLPEKDREHIAQVVGLSAVKYADLSQNRQSIVTFDWDKMLALNGNTAPYLLYTYARIQSIFRKWQSDFQGTEDYLHAPILLKEEVERDIAAKIHLFGSTLIKAAESYKPNLICDYLFELATLYNHFYQNHSVLKAASDEIRNSRLHLCKGIAHILKIGLALLGIQVLDRM